jgi:Mn-dependent DtxR family transcriptional regulator
MSAIESITEVFKKSPEALKAGDIAEKTGIDKKEVDKAIKKMLTEGVVISPKRCFYELKK